MARVLVVEDDANNLDVASRIIRASGHEALTAVDGVAGLDLARVEQPDAILDDRLLPRMDGWRLTRSLRMGPWAASIPIIAVSALALPSERARAILHVLELGHGQLRVAGGRSYLRQRRPCLLLADVPRFPVAGRRVGRSP